MLTRLVPVPLLRVEPALGEFPRVLYSVRRVIAGVCWNTPQEATRRREFKMVKETTMNDTCAPLAEPWAASKTPNQLEPEPPIGQSPAAEHHKRFVAPGAVLRAGLAKRAATEFLRW